MDRNHGYVPALLALSEDPWLSRQIEDRTVMNRPDPDTLTPGLIDGYARRAFSYGACGAFAIVLHDATGWPIVAITDAHNVYDGMAGGGSALHWTVRMPDGLLLDINGSHREDELVAEYDGDADDGKACAGIATRESAFEWYVEAQGEPISLELAATFVPAMLANVQQKK
jgi:hypothetical protein